MTEKTDTRRDLRNEVASGNWYPLPARCVLVWTCGMCAGSGRHTFGRYIGQRCLDCNGRPVRRYNVTEQNSTPDPAPDVKVPGTSARSARAGVKSPARRST